MEDNNQMIPTEGQQSTALSPDPEAVKLARLYLLTCEMLAKQAYEATAKQQQLNILAQQLTVAGTKVLYATAADPARQ